MKLLIDVFFYVCRALNPHRFCLLVLIFVIQLEYVSGQLSPQKISILKTQLHATKSDSTRVKLLCEIAGGYRFSEIDSGLHYAERSIELSKKINDAKRQVDALDIKGFILLEAGDIAGSLSCQLEGLKILEKNPDIKRMASILNRIGNIYMELAEYLTAIKYYNQSLNYFNSVNLIVDVHNELSNIGNVYELMGKLDSARIYHNKVYEFSLTNTDRNELTYGEMYARMGNMENASGNYQEALAHHRIGIKEANFDNDVRNITLNYLQMAKVYSQLQQIDSSIFYARKTIETGTSIEFKKAIFEGSTLLAKLFKREEQPDSALFYLELANTYKDSLYGIKTFQKLQLINLNEQRRQQDLQRENEELKDFYRMAVFLILLTVAFIIAIILWFNNKNQKKSNRLLKSQKEQIEASHQELRVEKKKSDDLLLNILPAEIAAELKENGKAKAKSINMVSVLFSDFKDFTVASTNLNAHDLVTEINICFAAFDATMSKYGIEKIKTIGDAYMAAGGLPVPSDDSVKNTVLAALEMQSFISQRRSDMGHKRLSAFEMRLGIHTGPVVAGIVGEKKFQYDLWGDTVNTASRLESNGEAAKVNISHDTYELLKDDPQFSFESRGKIKAKGKGEIEMWFVENVK